MGLKPGIVWLSKESACQCRRPGFDPWVRKIPWRRKWVRSLGQEDSLEKEMGDPLRREGPGYPLQCSCLENPMDRGAWQAGLQSMGSQIETAITL